MAQGPYLPLEDVLPLILHHIADDCPTLYQCTLVNHTFNNIVSAVLYHRVVFAPAPTKDLDLREKDSYSKPSLLNSSLTHNAKYVHEVQIGGFLAGRRSSTALIARTLREAFSSWTNLTSVVLCPTECHEDVFPEALRFLSHCSKLRHLAVGSSCMDEVSAPIIAQIGGLRTLSLSDPTRAILNLLPEWLSRLSSTLERFHLRGNCGSVTPGVLRSLIPLVKNIRAFSLGLSYSLEDGHVFNSLHELPQMEALELRYYWQIKQPLTVPEYPRLRNFTVHHNYMDLEDEIAHFCKWTKRIVSHSPIRSLVLKCVSDPMISVRGAHAAFDSLARHLVEMHSATLVALRMEHAFLNSDVVRQLCLRCNQIEELGINTTVDILEMFPGISKSMTRLRSVTLMICNIKQQKLLELFDDRKAQEFFENGSPALRVLRINTRKWEAIWSTVGPSLVQLVVEIVKPKKAPWERTPYEARAISPLD